MAFSVVKRAIVIAKRDLRRCYTDIGILAGIHQHGDLWARDGLFSGFGALCLSDIDIVNKTIDTFLCFQRRDGCIPYRIFVRSRNLLHYLGVKRQGQLRLRPNYRSFQSGFTVLDGCFLPIILGSELYRHNRFSPGVLEQVKKWFNPFCHAMNFLLSHRWGSLLWEGPFCSWEDSIALTGKTLYTNSLYVRALKDLRFLASVVGRKKQEVFYRDLSREADKAFQQLFWNGEFFAQWTDYRTHHIFSSYPNLLTVFFDIANRRQQLSIFSTIRSYRQVNGFIETNFRCYPWWRVAPINHLAGMSDYQNQGLIWLQPQLLYVILLQKLGKPVEAQDFFVRIAELIERHSAFYEVYERNGVPVKRLFYHAEHPFAWAAGMFLWSAKELGFSAGD